MMDPAEYARLEEIAARRDCSVAELIRVAIHERYLIAAEDRLAAAEDLLAMGIDIGEWDPLKAEIESRHSDAIS